MKCPNCGGDRVFHSHARTLRDRTLKRFLPVTFYRCHDCNWRRPRWQKLTGKRLILHTLSLVGYVGSIGVVIALVAGAVLLTLTFLGVPMPWSR